MTYSEKDYMDMINGKFDPNKKKEEKSKEKEKKEDDLFDIFFMNKIIENNLSSWTFRTPFCANARIRL